jgi:hypothetical protein
MEFSILLNHTLLKIHGWLQSQRKNILMSLRSQETLVLENLKLRQENLDLQKRLFDVLSDINQKIDSIQKIQIQRLSIICENDNTISKKNEVRQSESVPMFIPTPDSGTLKGNVQEPKKKLRKLNIEDSLDKLSKLQDNQ